MKKINSLKVMYIFLGLSLVSLTAIGFSNWVIINESSTTSTLAATIGDISNAELKAQIVDDSTDLNVRFDTSEGDTEGAITSGNDTYEKLYFYVTFTLDIGQLPSFSGIAIDLSFNSKDGGARTFIDNLGSDPQYIDTTLLSTPYSFSLTDSPVNDLKALNDYLSYSYTFLDKVATIKVQYTFKWGDAFGRQNPVKEAGTNPTNTLEKFNDAFSTFSDSITADKNTKVMLTITPRMK